METFTFESNDEFWSSVENIDEQTSKDLGPVFRGYYKKMKKMVHPGVCNCVKKKLNYIEDYKNLENNMQPDQVQLLLSKIGLFDKKVILMHEGEVVASFIA